MTSRYFPHLLTPCPNQILSCSLFCGPLEVTGLLRLLPPADGLSDAGQCPAGCVTSSDPNSLFLPPAGPGCCLGGTGSRLTCSQTHNFSCSLRPVLWTPDTGHRRNGSSGCPQPVSFPALPSLNMASSGEDSVPCCHPAVLTWADLRGEASV